MVDEEEKVEYKVERKNDAADEMGNAADKLRLVQKQWARN